MAYTRQNFKDGQVLTAAALNKIEDGIMESGVELFNCAEIQSYDGQQILDAYNAGKKLVYVVNETDNSNNEITYCCDVVCVMSKGSEVNIYYIKATEILMANYNV